MAENPPPIHGARILYPRRYFSILATLTAALLVAACSGESLSPTSAAIPAVEPAVVEPDALPVEPLVTLQDLMKYEVDASADAIWAASGTIVTRDGVVDRRPRTDAEWEDLRRHAVVLLEATNLLSIPKRRVAAVPFPSDGPGVYGSDEIQQQIDTRRDQFNAFALGLRGVAQQELAAIDARDVDALLRLGDTMDSACEACHRTYWYPNEMVPIPPRNPAPPPF